MAYKTVNADATRIQRQRINNNDLDAVNGFR